MPATERGPGGWPVDPEAAFHEAQGKFHEARKEAEHWRSNHADLLRRFKIAQVYRGEVVEATELLGRVNSVAGAGMPTELRRAIEAFLAEATASLEKTEP